MADGDVRPVSPVIELVSTPAVFPRGVSGLPIAQISFYGLRLSFCSLAIAQLTDEQVRTLVAHQIAHVYLLLADPRHEHDIDLAEEGVAWRLGRWGFDQSCLDEAIQRVGPEVIAGQVANRHR